MQSRAYRLAGKPPAPDQSHCAIPSTPCPPDVVRLLSEVLAAARDTVARCERALALLAEHQGSAPHALAVASYPDATGAYLHTPIVVGSNGHVHPVSTSPVAAAVVPGRLTPRETEVVRLIAAGLSNKEIAAALGVSVRTIEHHITNLYRKLGAQSKADATAWAVRQHLL
jgi:DNA-binding NarL/FixJ family response regulator